MNALTNAKYAFVNDAFSSVLVRSLALSCIFKRSVCVNRRTLLRFRKSFGHVEN